MSLADHVETVRNLRRETTDCRRFLRTFQVAVLEGELKASRRSGSDCMAGEAKLRACTRTAPHHRSFLWLVVLLFALSSNVRLLPPFACCSRLSEGLARAEEELSDCRRALAVAKAEGL